MAIGRPSKYDPKYCEMLVKHMASGLSYDSFAGHINVAIQTIYTWEKEHPAFLDAKRLGLSKNLEWWEAQGNKGMWTEKDGPQFNTTNFIFQMKNRHRWRNERKDEEEEKDKDKNPLLELLKTLPKEKLLELVKATVKE